MSDLDALLAAVLAAPADDLPRLVVADWLEEHGEPERAEFIRVQCELDRTPAPALAGREFALFPVVVEPFAGRFPYLRLSWRRGFVEAASGGLAPLRAALPEVLRHHPVRRATATDRTPLSRDGRSWWSFSDEFNSDLRHWLPVDMTAGFVARFGGPVVVDRNLHDDPFEVVAEYGDEEYDDGTFIDFASPDLAANALSAVLIDEARGLLNEGNDLRL